MLNRDGRLKRCQVIRDGKRCKRQAHFRHAQEIGERHAYAFAYPVWSVRLHFSACRRCSKMIDEFTLARQRGEKR